MIITFRTSAAAGSSSLNPAYKTTQTPLPRSQARSPRWSATSFLQGLGVYFPTFRAAGVWLLALITAPAAFVTALFGADEQEWKVGLPCAICRDDVHAIGERCPRALVADCTICFEVVELDAWGNCPNGSLYHTVTSRRPKWARPVIPTWARTYRAPESEEACGGALRVV